MILQLLTVAEIYLKQGRTHGYLSRVRVGRGGEKKLSVTDGPTDGRTDGPTDRAGCRVACTRLKSVRCVCDFVTVLTFIFFFFVILKQRSVLQQRLQIHFVTELGDCSKLTDPQ